MTAEEAIKRLGEIKVRLSDPMPFYAEHLEDWRALAREVTRDTLRALKPPAADADAWEASIETLAAGVSTSLLPIDLFQAEAGMLIDLRRAENPEGLEVLDVNQLTIDDIERWIQAGRDKESIEAPGKNLKAMDDEKTNSEIAWRIIYALKLQKEGWERLLKHIVDFAGVAAFGEMEPLLPQILIAWVQHFIPRASGDWEVWVARQTRV